MMAGKQVRERLHFRATRRPRFSARVLFLLGVCCLWAAAVAAERTIIVSVQNDTPFGAKFMGNVSKCTSDGTPAGVPLDCVFLHSVQTTPSTVCDALWYHLAPMMVPPPRVPMGPWDGRVNVATLEESASNYPIILNADFMDVFDVEMTTRFRTHVPSKFFVPSLVTLQENVGPGIDLFLDPLLPLERRIPAVAFLHSNCYSKNNRAQIVLEMMNAGIPLANLGKCYGNWQGRSATTPYEDALALYGGKQPKDFLSCGREACEPWIYEKVTTFSTYRACIAMENSNDVDYVTEKLFHAFRAGCVPIYMGAPNVQDFLPFKAADMMINVARYRTKQAFYEDVQQLLTNDTFYLKMLDWKRRAREGEAWLPGFRRLYDTIQRGDTRCRLCQFLHDRRQATGDARGGPCKPGWLPPVAAVVPDLPPAADATLHSQGEPPPVVTSQMSVPLPSGPISVRMGAGREGLGKPLGTGQAGGPLGHGIVKVRPASVTDQLGRVLVPGDAEEGPLKDPSKGPSKDPIKELSKEPSEDPSKGLSADPSKGLSADPSKGLSADPSKDLSDDAELLRQFPDHTVSRRLEFDPSKMTRSEYAALERLQRGQGEGNKRGG
eukprot:jgi/Mesvir1/21834/Mv04218-RA.1